MKRLIGTLLPFACLISIFHAVPAEAQIGLTASASQDSAAVVRPGRANAVYLRLAISTSLGTTNLNSLTLTNATTGIGTQAQRDLELGSLRLYLDDGDGVWESAQDTPLAVSSAGGGKIRYTGFNASVGATFGGTTYFHIVGNVPLLARDGDALDLSIESASDMTFQSGMTPGGTYPLRPAGDFPVDGMTAAQISVNPVPAGSILAGTQNALVLDLVLPPNGYEADELQYLNLINEGTAAAGSDIASLRAWVDDGNGIFDPKLDGSLGSLLFTGGSWQKTGLAQPVPAGGLRLFLSVDVADLASEGRTIRLSLPVLGVGMKTGNDGPIDAVVRNPNPQTISGADRVTFTTAALGASVVNPGGTKIQILHVLAKNTYSTVKTLSSLTITNTTTGSGSQENRDGEMSLTLRGDGNNSGTLNNSPNLDPILATATFHNGKATFSGFAWPWNPGQTRHLFVTSDVSLSGAKDLDVLSLNVSGSLDVDFGEPTRAVAVWPLDSGARLTVDGMVSNQVTNIGAPVATVGPGDGPILALDVRVPRNGYATDLLDSLIVENRGDAVLSDIAELRLWRDGGDGTFSGGSGDDRNLGPLTFSGGRWRSALLADTLAGAGTPTSPASHYFVGLTVSASPRDSATVRLAIPVGGIVVRSANDGPIDARVVNPETITISNSPVLVTMQIDLATSSVGQPVGALMVVRNVGSENLNGISPSALVASGVGALTLASGPSPASFNLAPAASDTFRWTYTASGPGDVTLTGYAQGTGSPSNIVHRSLDATSNTHQVFQSVSSIDYTAASSMPATISRGQTDLVPLSLTFTNNGGAQAASVRLLGLRIRLEDGSGAGIVPTDLLTAVAVASGTTVLLRKTALESTGAEVQLTLASPVTVDGTQSVTLSLGLDISPSATASNFRVAIVDSTWFAADDINSGAPVNARLQGSSYPVRSGLGRLVSDAFRLNVAEVPGPPERVGRGQGGVPLLTLRVENPGQSGVTSDVRISAFEVALTDTNGVAVSRASDYLGRIRVRTALQTLADRLVYATDGSTLTLVLSPPLSVPANTPIDVLLIGDMAGSAQLGAFQTLLGDSATFDVSDASSGERVPAVYATATITGPSITVEAAADTLAASGTPRFPPQVTVGKPDVAALTAKLRHPDAPGAARIRVDSLYVQCRDELRRPLTPSAYLDALRVLWNGVQIASVPNPPSTGGTVGVALPSPVLEPGDTDSLDIRVDISAAAPAGYIELAVFAGGIRAADANTGVATAVVPESGTEFPLTSGLTHLVAPARDLVVGLESRMPATLAADGDTITVGRLTLRNVAAASSDSIFLDHLTLRAGDRDFGTVAFGAAASGAVAYVSGVPWAQSATLTADSTQATLVAGSPIGVPPSGSVVVELRTVLRPGATPPTFRVGCDAAGIGVVQPSSALLQVQVQPAPGSTFPMWTEAGSFGGLTLGESYSNYPNPFAGGRQSTTFAFYLRQAGRVTLRIVTPSGDGVATLLDNAARPSGMNQSDLWDGRNGVGRVVRNGVYIAELTVKFDSGSHDRVIRKVAVVR
jgi:hypothetical protein